MRVDTKDLNPGVFFPFDEEEDDESPGGITIRLANGEILDVINKKCTAKKVVFRRGQRHEVIEEDEKRRSELLWEYVIMDWTGLDDEEGVPIPCTKDNKVLLMRGSVKIASFVGNCVEKLTEDSELYDEVLEKNSQT